MSTLGSELRIPFAPLVFGYEAELGKPIDIAADELVRHLAVFGTTGTGKTSLFLALMLQLMDRGRGFLFCTTKHDPMMPRALAWAAMQRQQLWRMRIFDPTRPVHAYNPAVTTNPIALANLYFSQLPPIEPTSEAKHYHDIQFEFLLLACSALMAAELRHVPDDILQLARNYEIAAPRLRRRLTALGKKDRMADLDAFFRRYYRRGEFQAHQAQEALSGLTSVLQGLDVGKWAGLLNQPFSDVDLLQGARRGLWTYMGLPPGLDADGGQLGRLFITDLTMAIDEVQRTEGELVHAPFVIFLDEFPSYALPQFARVFEQARSTGIGIILGSQTVSGLSDRASGLSEGFRDRVLGNCAHIMSFRLGPGEGAEYLARFTGKADRTVIQVSETESRGRTWSPLALSSWMGWTNRTDGRASFAGYRIQKDLVMESRQLTHELASRGHMMWLSPKGARTMPFTLWSLWAQTNAAPTGWDYASHCARWDREPPPPLDLGRYVRLVNIRRSEQAEAGANGAGRNRTAGDNGAAAPTAPSPRRAGGPGGATPQPGTTPASTSTSGARRRRRGQPQPTTLISYVRPGAPGGLSTGAPAAPVTPPPVTPAAPPAARPPAPSTRPITIAPVSPPSVRQPGEAAADDGDALEANVMDDMLDQDGDGLHD